MKTIYKAVLNLSQIKQLNVLGFKTENYESTWSWEKQKQRWTKNANDQSDYKLILNDTIPINGLDSIERIPTLTGGEILKILPGEITLGGVDYSLELYKTIDGKLKLRYMKGLLGNPLIEIVGDELLEICYKALIELLENGIRVI